METLDMVKIYKSDTPWVVRASGGIIAETRNARAVVVSGQSDIIFFPVEDVALPLFDPSNDLRSDASLGEAKYLHLAGKSGQLDNVAWQLTNPKGELAELANFMAFETGKVAVESL